uniref:MaoC family dehydratase N-terminal domain-containing protein n=1 Tax=Nocardia aurea TaxID=2144174 RepID=UPI000D69DFE3
VAAARAAGHRDLPVPPTFLFCLEMEHPDPLGYVRALGVDMSRLLHGEQRFTYYAMAYAGDLLTYDSRLTDVYSKKGGALDFLVRTTDVTRHDAPIARLTTVLVVRNPEAAP